MDVENIIFAAVIWAIVFLIALYIRWKVRRGVPMHFWAGSVVKPEEITDIPAYNRECCLMWLAYGAAFFLTGVVSLFSVMAGGILIAIVSTARLIPLFIVYGRIYNKYKR